MRQKKYLSLIVAVITSLFIFGACAEEPKTDLTPKAKTDESAILHNTETLTVGDVTVTVAADKWTGDPEIKKHVTPLKISVENNSHQPIKITYENISLVGKDGEVFSALPLYEMTGKLENASLAEEYEVVVESELEHREFYVYPMYQAVHTDFPVTEYEFYENPSYYEEYYRTWENTGLPTKEMRQKALPEGILGNEGSLSGFVFFQKVDPDLVSVTLNMDLINAETNEVFGAIELPFWVMVEPDMEN